jgi:type I restriction enzyme S subunit
MKQGWEIKRLDDLCQIELGKTPYRADKSFWDAEKETDNVWLSIADLLNTDGDVVSDSKEYITDKAVSVSKIVRKGTLLLSFKLTLGRLAFAGKDLFTNEAIAAITIKNEKVIDKYFLYQFLSFFDWNAATEGDVKVKGKTLNKAKLKEIEVNLPKSLEEQQHIVSIIDEAFGAIDKAKVNAEQNLKNAKELFESYLQNVFESKGEGWVEKTLGDVCSLYQGIAINAKTKHALVEKSDLPLLRIKDLRNNSEEQYIDPNNFPKNALVNEEDILYTRTGNSLGLVFRGRRGVLHNNSFKIIPNSTLSRDYLFIWLQNPIFKAKIFELAYKAAQPDITHAIFKLQEIAIPPLKDQINIVQKLDALSTETKKLEAIYQKKIADLQELKKSVLQKAFSGELTSKSVEV